MRHRATITIPKDRSTLFQEALCREASIRLHRENEATILEDLPPLETPPLPKYVREEVKWGEIILSAFNIKQYLP